MTLPVTGALITFNEEASIDACLETLQFCQEIIVVDSGSTDRTVERAQARGAKVIHRAWTGYADQRNFLISMASQNWVLFLDADERFSTDMLPLLPELLKDTSYTAYRFPRKSFYLNRWISHGGWYPDYQTRLLKVGANRFENNLVHERVLTQGEVKTIEIPLIHYPFTSIADQIETNNRYSGLLAQVLHQKGSRFSTFHLLTKPLTKFFECYVIKRGFLDGLPGFFVAVGAAYSVFLKWSKLWEIQALKTLSHTIQKPLKEGLQVPFTQSLKNDTVEINE